MARARDSRRATRRRGHEGLGSDRTTWTWWAWAERRLARRGTSTDHQYRNAYWTFVDSLLESNSHGWPPIGTSILCVYVTKKSPLGRKLHRMRMSVPSWRELLSYCVNELNSRSGDGSTRSRTP